jgi:UDP-N-acetylmuramyl pentapeptide phosphotransferase/UDP-N-acetylglucosamine-1-phosphate transferase
MASPTNEVAMMGGFSVSKIILWCCLAAFVVAFGIVRSTIAYALRRGMLDAPGRRRSHTIPTPRGGGLGIVVGALVGMTAALLLLPEAPSLAIVAALFAGTLAVAAIGWWDDHGSLPVLPRLFVQLGSTALLATGLVLGGLHWLWWAPLVLAGVWSINLHNFMDGIDGLLAQQAIFVGVALALLASAAGQAALAGAAWALAAATLAFWWFNRSPARIFMGDVGSGTLGLIVFALTAMLWRAETSLLWPALMFSSSFAIDATLTLLLRMLRGRRWYTPHREHLYQWLVRRGATHGQAAGRYLAWNLLVTAPLAWIAFERPAWAPGLCVALYVVAAALWWGGKRQCLRRRARHVPA